MTLAGDQVHITPLGVEKDRIVTPVIEEGADRVILLEYIPRIDYPKNLLTEIEEELNSASVEFTRRQANLEDLFEALNAFGETIQNETTAKDDVFVNISSGNKIGAVGAMMACMESQAATPYYVRADTGTSMTPDANRMAENISGWDAIPLYQIKRPTNEQLQIMNYILEANTELRDQDEPFRIKSELVEFAEDEELEFIQHCEGNSQAKHNRLRRHIIEPLKDDWGFVRIKSVGTSDRVMLTEDGKNTVRGFYHLID